jgi:hypothetical protein
MTRLEKMALFAVFLSLVLSVKNCIEDSRIEEVSYENDRLLEYGTKLEEENQRLRAIIRQKERKCSEQ